MGKENAYSVLLLDDEIMVIRPLERALKAKGFIVWGTTDTEEAVHLVEGHRPSVACIDLHMPKVNGIEVIKKMRQIMPDIRIVVVTGHLAEFQEAVGSLNLRVVEKTSRVARELEAVIAEELELSRKDLDGLKTREKVKTKLRVLFVDDEAEQADFSCEIVTSSGAEAEAAHSPEEAMEKIRNFKPNVLCTDLKMQEIDGDELIRRAKASPDNSCIKLYVGMTGFFHEKERLLNAGAAEVLTKPVNLTDFLAALQRWEELIAGRSK